MGTADSNTKTITHQWRRGSQNAVRCEPERAVEDGPLKSWDPLPFVSFRFMTPQTALATAFRTSRTNS
jgi:hypothetical protein